MAKITCTKYDWFWFCYSSVQKVAWDFEANQLAYQSQLRTVSTFIWKVLYAQETGTINGDSLRLVARVNLNYGIFCIVFSIFFRPVYTYSVVYRCTSGIQPIKTWTASSRGCLKLIYPRLNINWRDISFLTWTGDNQERYNKYALCLKTSVLAIVTTLLREAYSLESCFLVNMNYFDNLLSSSAHVVHTTTKKVISCH